MITFACLSPHAPIFLPEVGSPEDQEQVRDTIDSLESLGASLKKAKPEIIIISSPHTDWGINVPLYFLDPPASFKVADYQTPGRHYNRHNSQINHLSHYNYSGFATTTLLVGQALYSDLLKNCSLNIALVGSGDMSHCLKIDGPYGFHPDGPKYDQALAEALKKKDLATILQLDELYPEAGECGLRSFSFILGILEAAGLNYQPEILSYEGPFGVGYLVANIKLKNNNNYMTPLTRLAKQAVETYITTGKIIEPPKNLPSTFLKERAGVFVTIEKDQELRGCIGTYLPVRNNIAEETIYNALAAATEDYRFMPIQKSELPYLTYTVSILSKPEQIQDIAELDPKKYGVIVSTPDRLKTGLLLPDLEGVNTVEEQIMIACQKAGIDLSQEKIALYRFTTEKYQ